MSEKKAIGRALEKSLTLLQPLFSPRRPQTLVEKSFNKLSSEDQWDAYKKIKILVVTNSELALVFACQVGQARAVLSSIQLNSWLEESLSIYDHQGLYPAARILKEFDDFKQQLELRQTECLLKDIKPRLDIFIRGLVGRDLSVKKSEKVYTDTAFIYLPKSINQYESKRKNMALYKAMACFLWAQNWYGTFKQHGFQALSTQERLATYKNPILANNLFLRLENIRLLARIRIDFPGLIVLVPLVLLPLD